MISCVMGHMAAGRSTAERWGIPLASAVRLAPPRRRGKDATGVGTRKSSIASRPGSAPAAEGEGCCFTF
eukprot:scaffold15611_cov110-Isochrysis_galbana.AAC.1